MILDDYLTLTGECLAVVISVLENKLVYDLSCILWPVNLVIKRLGVCLLCNNSDNGLAGKTKQIPCPCHLTYRAGSSSSARFFTGQNLRHNLYLVHHFYVDCSTNNPKLLCQHMHEPQNSVICSVSLSESVVC